MRDMLTKIGVTGVLAVCGSLLWGTAAAATPSQAARQVGASVADAARSVMKWKPGNPVFVSEADANDFLQGAFDHVYCDGVSRFGERGEFPYEEYLMFDCAISHAGDYCTGWRYRSVKGKQPGSYRMVEVKRPKRC